MLFTINKETTTNSDAVVSYHVVTKAELSGDCDAILLYVSSWPTKAARDAGHDPIAYSVGKVELAALQNSNTLVEELKTSITASGWLAGGIVGVPDDSDTYQKNKAWLNAKTARELEEYGGFIWNTKKFNSDEKSQLRIYSAAIEAMNALRTNTIFHREWVLADNTTIELTASDMLSVSDALAEHIRTVHEHSQVERARIFGVSPTPAPVPPPPPLPPAP